MKQVDRLGKESGNLEPRDLPGSVRNLAVASGIHQEKAKLLAGEPTMRVQRDLSEVLRELKSIGLEIEGTAVEEQDVPDAEVMEG